MAHSFLVGLACFSVCIKMYQTQVLFLQLLAPDDYSLPDLQSHLFALFSPGIPSNKGEFQHVT